MQQQWSVFSATCPSRESLARIANKWTAMIVISLHEQPLRFSELLQRIDGISKKVLVDTLRALERDGMLDRVSAAGVARYRLTDLGRTLHEPLLALQHWAEAHVAQVLQNRESFDEAQDDRILGQG